MRVLHICNDFTGSKVHSNLYRSLNGKVDHQVVYTYFDGKEKVGKNSFSSNNTEIIYDDILSPWLRKIYPLKIWWVYRHLIKKIDPSKIDCIHATTLFSDGGVAYQLYQEYKIPYVVAVRATDLRVYITKAKLLWKHGQKILLNAKKIVLIDKAYLKELENLEFSRPIWDKIKDKIIMQPNGIDDYWIENISREPRHFNNRICYVGTFVKRKDIPRLIQAIDILHEDYPDIQLNLIGGGVRFGYEGDLVERMAKERYYVSIEDWISDKNLLKERYRENCIFAMPSWDETFGLVYIEALSQNMRLLYAENDGIDGLLDNVGVAVDPFSVDSITKGLRLLIEGYDAFDGNKKVDFSNFDWNRISDRYMGVYSEII